MYELRANGDFRIENPPVFPERYLPLVNDGIISSITADLAGDAKTDHNHYLLEPASQATLQHGKATRNFWFDTGNGRPWSVSGRSPWQQLEWEQTRLEGGLLWQRTTRSNPSLGLEASVLSFVPTGREAVEVMQVTVTNIGPASITVTPTAAIPLYCRSADNLRDHRHVTSLLHRVAATEDGVVVTPTLSFDERGHRPNQVSYGVYAREEDDGRPVGFCPVLEDFIGGSGSLEWPDGVVKDIPYHPAGWQGAGYEAVGAIRFAGAKLAPGEKRSYQVLLCVGEPDRSLLFPREVERRWQDTRDHWQRLQPMEARCGDDRFSAWMRWVGAQPVLRRICGCSYLPHHDYGRGGRGWRDLWQDCLALILQDPAAVREPLCAYTEGIRLDGTNATIIGEKPGQFLADRNQIVRVWMDHGVWPVRTIHLYLQQTGDTSILLERRAYFRDSRIRRGEGTDPTWRTEDGTVYRASGEPYQGTVLEHLLAQTLTAFFDVGERGHIRLRDADWNDGLDMAADRGESVAFTAAYADNLNLLADCVDSLSRQRGLETVPLLAELTSLLQPAEIPDQPENKRRNLADYCEAVANGVAGVTEEVPCRSLAGRLRVMANWINDHIRSTEPVEDGRGGRWFNSYYDNNGRPVEGPHESGAHHGHGVRMMLTGQVFTILSGAADDAFLDDMIQAIDRYLYDPHAGGYRLNTDFREVKLDMGRMFGFAYGHKENGAVFSHMAVMYGYALYSRGRAREGWKALSALYRQSMDFESGRIYPGIPEYFDARGRGMYPYLTGAASWYVLTLQTQVFGARGQAGDLLLEPKLVAEQFGGDGEAAIRLRFARKDVTVRYHNPKGLDYGAYRAAEACVVRPGVEGLPGVNESFPGRNGGILIPRRTVAEWPGDAMEINVNLV